MQMLMTDCPFCGHKVETTIENLDDPVTCPNCDRPFEMEMPVAEVNEVRNVPDDLAEKSSIRAQQRSEKTLLKVHPAMARANPIAFLGCLALVTLGGYGLLAGALAGQQVPFWLSLWPSVALAAIGGVLLLSWWIHVMFVTLTVTDSRTILREGIISRDTSEVLHDDVTNIQMDQNIFERIFNVGDIGLSTSGQDYVEVIARGIPNPDHVVEVVRANQH